MVPYTIFKKRTLRMPASSEKRPQLQATKKVTQGYSTTDSRVEKAENFKLENNLQKLIEFLRKELEHRYFKKDSFLHPEVLQMSQQLDEYIVVYQKLTKH